MSTFMAKKETLERKWYVIDAAGKPLGKTAVAAANILRGKHRPAAIQKLVDDNEIPRRAQAYAVETRERAEKDADSIYNQACAQVDKMLSGAAAALSRSASELAALRDSLLTQGSARQQDR